MKPQNLQEFLDTRTSKKQRIFVIAIIDGVKVFNTGALSYDLQNKGIHDRNDIPSKYWTLKGFEYFKGKEIDFVDSSYKLKKLKNNKKMIYD